MGMWCKNNNPKSNTLWAIVFNVYSLPKATTSLYKNILPVVVRLKLMMVEARGVEPLSESQSIRFSPGAVDQLRFPDTAAGQQAAASGSP